ncbi:MAG: FHA domain-containing protein [Pseudohongiellaceae bacterium]
MSGKLEFCFNHNKIGEFPLDKEVMTIGRKDDNDIRIENLAVSGHHAKLLTIFDDSFLEDLNSTNGTFVNGRSVNKIALKNGDVITIGKHELRYVNAGKSADSDSEKTVFLSPKQARQITTPELSTLVRAHLQILNGKNAGKQLQLEKDSVKLGKPGVQVVLINQRPDGHFIVVLEQAENCRPLKINGEEIGARSIKLQNHDVIEINQLKIEYYLTDH